MPGTVLGVWGGLFGALIGVLAPSGKGKALVLTLWGLTMAIGAAFLVLGIVAFLQNQPYGIWYGFGLAGILVLGVMGSLFPVILTRYRQAAARKSSP